MKLISKTYTVSLETSEVYELKHLLECARSALHNFDNEYNKCTSVQEATRFIIQLTDILNPGE